MKKFILSAFTATSLLLSSSPIFAAPLTISLGIPQEQTFTEKNEAGGKIEADKPSGYFLGIKFPVGFGLGIDSYKTKFTGDTSKIETFMYNIFYQFPIPVIDITIGLGSGKTKLACSDCAEDYTDPESGIKTGYKAGEANQWFTSFGIQLTQLINIHMSYRSVTSNKIEQVYSGTKVNYSGNVRGIGLAFNF
ncbi:MAG: hypothetical protein H8E67_03265 [Proteobacteria bacterium]|jgi:hypothetical protein|nr:hypothetical protein [Pseudomonadota bacterium]